MGRTSVIVLLKPEAMFQSWRFLTPPRFLAAFASGSDVELVETNHQPENHRNLNFDGLPELEHLPEFQWQARLNIMD